MPKRVYVKSHYRSIPRGKKNSGCPTVILVALVLVIGIVLAIHQLLIVA